MPAEPRRRQKAAAVITACIAAVCILSLVSTSSSTHERLDTALNEMLATAGPISIAPGTYLGMKKVVAITIHAGVVVHPNKASLDFSVTATNPDITIKCKDEPYTVDDTGEIKLTNLKTPGNCVKKELKEKSLKLTSMLYKDGTINVAVKYAKLLPADILLFHQEDGSKPPTGGFPSSSSPSHSSSKNPAKKYIVLLVVGLLVITMVGGCAVFNAFVGTKATKHEMIAIAAAKREGIDFTPQIGRGGGYGIVFKAVSYYVQDRDKARVAMRREAANQQQVDPHSIEGQHSIMVGDTVDIILGKCVGESGKVISPGDGYDQSAGDGGFIDSDSPRGFYTIELDSGSIQFFKGSELARVPDGDYAGHDETDHPDGGGVAGVRSPADDAGKKAHGQHMAPPKSMSLFASPQNTSAVSAQDLARIRSVSHDVVPNVLPKLPKAGLGEGAFEPESAVKPRAATNPKHLTILDCICGYAKPGQLVGILGPSGCGKSSLLDILAHRPKIGKVAGTVEVTNVVASGAGVGSKQQGGGGYNTSGINLSVASNSSTGTSGGRGGEDSVTDHMRARMGYMSQEDAATLLPTETVLETLLFSALMRSPGTEQQRMRSSCCSKASAPADLRLKEDRLDGYVGDRYTGDHHHASSYVGGYNYPPQLHRQGPGASAATSTPRSHSESPRKQGHRRSNTSEMHVTGSTLAPLAGQSPTTPPHDHQHDHNSNDNYNIGGGGGKSRLHSPAERGSAGSPLELHSKVTRQPSGGSLVDTSASDVPELSEQEKAKRRAYQLLHALKLNHVAYTQVGGLSGGEKRRLSLGVELVTNPTVLLCDEVTSALDSKSCDVVLELLMQYTRQGHCAVVTIHQPSTRVLRRFDSVLLLSSGGQQLYFGSAFDEGYGVDRVSRIMTAAQMEFAIAANDLASAGLDDEEEEEEEGAGEVAVGVQSEQEFMAAARHQSPQPPWSTGVDSEGMPMYVGRDGMPLTRGGSSGTASGGASASTSDAAPEPRSRSNSRGRRASKESLVNAGIRERVLRNQRLRQEEAKRRQDTLRARHKASQQQQQQQQQQRQQVSAAAADKGIPQFQFDDDMYNEASPSNSPTTSPPRTSFSSESPRSDSSLSSAANRITFKDLPVAEVRRRSSTVSSPKETMLAALNRQPPPNPLNRVQESHVTTLRSGADASTPASQRGDTQGTLRSPQGGQESAKRASPPSRLAGGSGGGYHPSANLNNSAPVGVGAASASAGIAMYRSSGSERGAMEDSLLSVNDGDYLGEFTAAEKLLELAALCPSVDQHDELNDGMDVDVTVRIPESWVRDTAIEMGMDMGLDVGLHESLPANDANEVEGRRGGKPFRSSTWPLPPQPVKVALTPRMHSMQDARETSIRAPGTKDRTLGQSLIAVWQGWRQQQQQDRFHPKRDHEGGELWRQADALGELWRSAVRRAVFKDGADYDEGGGAHDSNVNVSSSVRGSHKNNDGTFGAPAPHSHRAMLAQVDLVLELHEQQLAEEKYWKFKREQALLRGRSAMIRSALSKPFRAPVPESGAPISTTPRPYSSSTDAGKFSSSSNHSDRAGGADDGGVEMVRQYSSGSGSGSGRSSHSASASLVGAAGVSGTEAQGWADVASPPVTQRSVQSLQLTEAEVAAARREMRRLEILAQEADMRQVVRTTSACPGSTLFKEGMSLSASCSYASVVLQWRRFYLLCARSGRQWVRDPSLFAAQLLLVLLMSALIGGFAHNLDDDFTGVQTRVFLFNFMVLFFSLLGMSSIGALVHERHVFARERANGYYGTGTYALAKALVCDVLPLRVLPPLLFGSLVYQLIGLNNTNSDCLAYFLLVLVLVNVTASSACMFLSASCGGVGEANLLAAAFFLYSYMFSGLFMAGANGPVDAIKFTSIFFYAWEALVANEFDKKSSFRFNPKKVQGMEHSQVKLSGEVLLANFNLNGNRMGMDVGALVIFSVVTLVATAIVLHRSKFRR